MYVEYRAVSVSTQQSRQWKKVAGSETIDATKANTPAAQEMPAIAGSLAEDECLQIPGYNKQVSNWNEEDWKWNSYVAASSMHRRRLLTSNTTKCLTYSVLVNFARLHIRRLAWVQKVVVSWTWKVSNAILSFSCSIANTTFALVVFLMSRKADQVPINPKFYRHLKISKNIFVNAYCRVLMIFPLLSLLSS